MEVNVPDMSGASLVCIAKVSQKQKKVVGSSINILM